MRPGPLLCSIPALALLLLPACKRKQDNSELERPGGAGTQEQAYVEQQPGQVIAPTQVCTHLMDLAAASAGVEAEYDEQLLRECERELGLEAQARGPDNWNAIASCVLQSRNEADIDACDRNHPMPGAAPAAGGPLPQDGPERRACDHMVDVLLTEASQAEGSPIQITEAERREISDDCVAKLLTDQPQIDPVEYQRMLDCVQMASSSAEMKACEG